MGEMPFKRKNKPKVFLFFVIISIIINTSNASIALSPNKKQYPSCFNENYEKCPCYFYTKTTWNSNQCRLKTYDTECTYEKCPIIHWLKIYKIK